MLPGLRLPLGRPYVLVVRVQREHPPSTGGLVWEPLGNQRSKFVGTFFSPHHAPSNRTPSCLAGELLLSTMGHTVLDRTEVKGTEGTQPHHLPSPWEKRPWQRSRAAPQGARCGRGVAVFGGGSNQILMELL